MKLRDLGTLFILAALWGASFLFIRISVPVLRPFPLVTVRVLLAGVALLVFAVITRQHIQWKTKEFFVLGVLNNVIPYTLIATAELHLAASTAAILNATTPLFSVLVAAVWLKDPLTAKKLGGLLCGLLGVAIVVGWRPEQMDTTDYLSALAILGAACSYGVASVYSKVSFKNVSPLSIAVGQLFSAGMLISPLALTDLPTQPLSNRVLISVVGLAIFSTALAYLLYFHLIRTVGPTSAASVTLLIPFFSGLWGAIFLGETLATGQILGFTVILVGLLLVTGLQFPIPKIYSAAQNSGSVR